MSSTNYAGIDYGLGKSNMDAETCIRYGVIAQSSVSPESVDDIWHGPHSRDLAFEAAENELKDKLRAVLSDYFSDHKRGSKGDGMNDGTSRLDVAVEDAFNALDGWAENLDTETEPLYEHDGYKIARCLETDLFVLKSPFYTYAQFCSPCVPGAGNLDSPFDGPVEMWAKAAEESGFPKVYCLGHDWFDDNLAPYPVFRVDNNEQVQP